jgi:hypothetical protein
VNQAPGSVKPQNAMGIEKIVNTGILLLLLLYLTIYFVEFHLFVTIISFLGCSKVVHLSFMDFKDDK